MVLTDIRSLKQLANEDPQIPIRIPQMLDRIPGSPETDKVEVVPESLGDALPTQVAPTWQLVIGRLPIRLRVDCS